MVDVLLKAMEETQAQKKSGLLMALVQLTGTTDAARPPDADLSFFFKNGELSSMVNRGTQGVALTALLPMISKVVRTQWVAMVPAMIPAGDAPLSVDEILELMGRKKAPAASTAPARAADAAITSRTSDKAVELEHRAEQVFMQFMGRNGAATLQKIRNQYDPHVDEDGYVKACVAQLEPLIGKDSALKMIKG
jgi:hypothetical protein